MCQWQTAVFSAIFLYVSSMTVVADDSHPFVEPLANTVQSGDSTTVRLYKPEWSSATLLYLENQDEPDFSRRKMHPGKKNWWSVTVPARKLEFAFTGDHGERIDLGGTQGCYPNDHYACEEDNNPHENFRTSASQIWVKNGLIYTSNPDFGESDNEFSVMSVNLHTYQEFKTDGTQESELSKGQVKTRVRQHRPLFNNIAAAINQLQPDVICLQEVGEWAGDVRDPVNAPFGEGRSNMVRQILSRVKNKRYSAFMDWSHFGFDSWREGSAIISKHPLLKTESRYVSNTDNGTHDWWKSRNIVKAQVNLGALGKINVFSVHMGWWDDAEEPFQDQFANLTHWAQELEEAGTSTLFCGDFNQVAGTSEYQFIVNGTGYNDQYALANPDGLLDPTIGGTIDGWTGENAKRIDLFLLNDNSPLAVKQSQRLFTEKAFGRVSDHTGIYAQFGPRHQFYLTGSISNGLIARGLGFEYLGGSNYRLITKLGAAMTSPEKGLYPHRLLVKDRSDNQSIGSPEPGGEILPLDQEMTVVNGMNAFIFELDQPGLYQFDLDSANKTLRVTTLENDPV